NARNDLERHARPLERLGLLAPTPEEERVAVLEPHDEPPATRMRHQQQIDVGLRQSPAPVRRPDADHLRPRPHGREQARRNEVIADDDVRLAEYPVRAQREKAGIPRAGAHQDDAAGHARPSSAVAPRASNSSAPRGPMVSAAAASPRSCAVRHRPPSMSLTRARSVTRVPSIVACAASGVLQSPPRATRKPRSARMAAAATGSSS